VSFPLRFEILDFPSYPGMTTNDTIERRVDQRGKPSFLFHGEEVIYFISK
jgi:hypothetical protein